MKYYQKHIQIIIWMLFSTLVVGQSNDIDITLRSSQESYEAGANVILQFSNNSNTQPLLYCSNSYSSTIITPTNEDHTLTYQIPDFITNKSGRVHWKLIAAKAISGAFTMRPKKDVISMESYIGPPTIEAGDIDYTMLVVIPTDSLDNPLPENTPVSVKHRFLESQVEDEVVTKNVIAYKNISSRRKSGRLFVSSSCLEKNSTENTIEVLPAIATDFTISSESPHNYADGNQITSFYTSIIKDTHENIVADGTYVTFFIRNEEGNILKTSGTTVQGIATAKMIHPDHASEWTVKAYVHGMAESNRISVVYEQVIKDFEIAFAKANRAVKIGPLQSFMGQMIPDGFEVSLAIYKNNELLEIETKTSRSGYVSFYLKKDVFKNGTYSLKVTTGGIEKNIQNVKLW